MDRATLESQWRDQTPDGRFQTAQAWLRAALAGVVVSVERSDLPVPGRPELLAWVTASHPSHEPTSIAILLAAAVFLEEEPGVAAELVETVVLPWAYDLLEMIDRVREQEARERFNRAQRDAASRAGEGIPKPDDYSAEAQYYQQKFAEEGRSRGS